MSSNKNDNSAAATAVGAVGAGLAFMAVFLFAVAAFVASVLTILCVIACYRPLKIGKWTLSTEEAAWFLIRGSAGSFLVPAFVLFCDIAFNLGVVWYYLPHMMVFGYVMGSLGWEILTAESNPQPEVEILPPVQQLPPQSRQAQPSVWQQQDSQPFGYASWDDEEELRK